MVCPVCMSVLVATIVTIYSNGPEHPCQAAAVPANVTIVPPAYALTPGDVLHIPVVRAVPLAGLHSQSCTVHDDSEHSLPSVEPSCRAQPPCMLPCLQLMKQTQLYCSLRRRNSQAEACDARGPAMAPSSRLAALHLTVLSMSSATSRCCKHMHPHLPMVQIENNASFVCRRSQCEHRGSLRCTLRRQPLRCRQLCGHQ